MSHVQPIPPPVPHPASSPLVLSDRLITLAQDAARAGFRPAAERLIELAYDVLDEAAPGLAPEFA